MLFETVTAMFNPLSAIALLLLALIWFDWARELDLRVDHPYCQRCAIAGDH